MPLAGCERLSRQPAPFGGGATVPSQSAFALNTVNTITLYDEGYPHIYHAVFARLHELEGKLSMFDADSYVSRINAAAGVEAVQVHPDVFYVIERAVFYAEISGGAFDPTIAPLTMLWGITGDAPRVPSQQEIDGLLPLVNWRNIELDPETQSVFLREHGMAIDLGAIAKGYAADEVAAVIRRAGVPRAMIDLGGNVLLVGAIEEGRPWRIGLQSPFGERGAFFGILQTEETSVVTSGVNERYFTAGGIHYHHIFSPFSGRPAESGLLSVTIITGVSMDADALSTSAFVLGQERGRAFIEGINGAQAIFVTEDMSVYLTSGLTAGVDFILIDSSFRLAN